MLIRLIRRILFPPPQPIGRNAAVKAMLEKSCEK